MRVRLTLHLMRRSETRRTRTTKKSTIAREEEGHSIIKTASHTWLCAWYEQELGPTHTNQSKIEGAAMELESGNGRTPLRISARRIGNRVVYGIMMLRELVDVCLDFNFANSLREKGEGGYCAMMVIATLISFVVGVLGGRYLVAGCGIQELENRRDEKEDERRRAEEGEEYRESVATAMRKSAGAGDDSENCCCARRGCAKGAMGAFYMGLGAMFSFLVEDTTTL